MTTKRQKSEFPEYTNDNRWIWDANAHWWDNCIGDGNDFQTPLIEPSIERLLAVFVGDAILDMAYDAGCFARYIAELRAQVVAFDYNIKFIECPWKRTPKDNTTKVNALLSLGVGRFDKAVCTMDLIDMLEITPLFSALTRMLKSRNSRGG